MPRTLLINFDMKYIDAEKLIAEIERLRKINIKALDADHITPGVFHGRAQAFNYLFEFIDSLQHELTPDTDVLHTELVNLLKTYRIGEETARTMADRIADTYGVQRYIDGLCDGMDKEDMKKEQEQPEVFDTMAFQKGVKEGKRLAIETIRSRIDEILGDAQPAPILRMELQELIKKIEA